MAWFMGPFITAHMKADGGSTEARAGRKVVVTIEGNCAGPRFDPV